MRIHVALAVLPPAKRRSINIVSDRDREEFVDDLVMRIMGRPESEAVLLVPSMVGSVHSPEHGKWGVNEPHPHPDLPLASH